MAAVPSGKVGSFTLPVDFKHANTECVEEFLAGSASELGKKDLSRPLQSLEQHWVQSVGDLRLLVQEGMLRTLGLPLRLCVWIEDELGKVTGSAVVDEKSAAASEQSLMKSTARSRYTSWIDSVRLLLPFPC